MGPHAYAQVWNLTVSAEFTGLHIWLKVVLGDEVWDDDYMQGLPQPLLIYVH